MAFAALLVAAFCVTAFAQGTSTLTGTVTDPNGAVVSGATVTATNVATNVSTTTQTTDAGVYRFPTNPFGLGSGFNLAFRRAALDEAGAFDEQLGAGATFPAGEDTDMLYRVMRAGWAVVCSDDVTVTHHEWRGAGEELRLHYGYGLGAGAQTARLVAEGDRTAARVALAEARKHLVTLLVATLTLRLRVARLQPPFLAGLVAGYLRRAMRS
jgi:GT2 family glycosyltransferase